MTKLQRKSVDVEKILENPRQTWMERLLCCSLSKPMLTAFFLAVMGRVSKAFSKDVWIAQTIHSDGGVWGIAVQPVRETFQNGRKFFFILYFFFLCVFYLLALFKKVSWFVFITLFSFLGAFICLGMLIDYMTTETISVAPFAETLGELDSSVPEEIASSQPFLDVTAWGFVFLVFLFWMLPIIVSFCQYKYKKMEKSLLKRHCFIWFSMWIIPVILFGILYFISG